MARGLGSGSSRQDALLLLWRAVWYSAQGQGQCGHWFRALGGVPSEPWHALPQRSQALPPGQPPRPTPDPAHAQHGRVSRGRLARGARLRRGPYTPLQTQDGRDAFALLSGASLTNEKAYLIGKFARLALRTKHIDYNGRLCMVSAGAANRLAFGIDRGGQPWSDIPLAKCLILAGINVGECFPILTDYIWRARDNGARIIV